MVDYHVIPNYIPAKFPKDMFPGLHGRQPCNSGNTYMQKGTFPELHGVFPELHG
jgi:hypothetical protein